MESEFQVQCPFCGEIIWMEFYPEDGTSQETVIDCEVCCNPIQYSIEFLRDGEIRLRAERAQ